MNSLKLFRLKFLIVSIFVSLSSSFPTTTSHRQQNGNGSLFQYSSGKVFLIGGATKDSSASIYNALREATGKETPRIAVAISAAASLVDGLEAYYEDIPDSLSYENLFKMYGFIPDVIELAVDNYQTACSAASSLGQKNIEIVRNADVVFFNGGDQSRHARAWFKDDGTDSDIMRVLRDRFIEGLVIAGTSAGAAIQSNPTYGEGYSYGYYYFNADLKSCRIGEQLVDDRDGTNSFRYDENGGYMKGFGFVQDVLVDTHFDARGRFGRLAVAMQDVGQSFGIGVGEDTALYINRDTATCLGNDGVWIIDSSRATFPTETYFAAKNLRMTYLTEGDTYTLSTKKVTSTKSQITSTSGQAYESDKVFDGPEGIDSIKSLVTSTDSQSVGYSYEERPTARVVFRKGEGEISYADSSRSKFTVDDLSFDIGSITLAKSSRHHGLKLESSRH